MFRRFLPWILVYLAVMLDISVIPFLTSSEYIPLFSLVTVIALGLLLGRRRGALLGLMAGLMIDVLVNDPYGLMTILVTLSGFTAGFIGRKFMNHMWTTVVTALGIFFVVELVMMGYLAMYASSFSAALLAPAGIRVVIQTVLVQVFYLIFNAWLQHKVSRYSVR